MSCSLEHFDGSFPVTSLKEFQLGASNFLLQGQGPFVSIINVKNEKLLHKIKVFKRNNVHGFMIDEQRCRGQEYITVIAWGSSSLRVIQIFGQNTDEDPRIVCGTFEHAAPDWIYDVCPAHSEDTFSLAYLITGHNSVLSIDVKEVLNSKYNNAIQLRHVFTGVKSTLYSANIIALSSSHILIAAGTVFGEIIVWSCFKHDTENVSSSIHHFFTGHDGSIFGVSISDELSLTREGREQPGRLLASCSDDRTVRVWDISDCIYATSADQSAYVTDGFDLRSTGFGSTAPGNISSGSESSVATCWGHISRIWGIYFLPIRSDIPTTVNLVSRGEDATCQLWRLDWAYQQPSGDIIFDMSNISTLNHHAGKHIWSLALSKGDIDTKYIYTGGNDGAVRVFKLASVNNTANNEIEPSSRISPYSPQILIKAAHSKINDGCESQVPRVLTFVSQNSFIVVYISGLVRLGVFDDTNHPSSKISAARPRIFWETLTSEEDLRSFVSVSALSRHGLAIIGSSTGVIRLYNHANKSLVEIAKVPSRPAKIVMLDTNFDDPNSDKGFRFLIGDLNSREAHIFNVKITEGSYNISQTTLILPSRVERSTCCVVCRGRFLVVGGKSGQILLYDLDPTKERIECLSIHREAHGGEFISFINAIEDGDSLDSGYVLTGGADGHYCLFRIFSPPNENNIYRLQQVHRSSTPLTQIERGYFDCKTGNLFLLGFRGVNLILWNETTQTEMLTVDCGGARRAWDFILDSDITGKSTIIWTQARSLHALVADFVAHRPLQLGGHGREIKGLAIAGKEKNYNLDRALPLIASGAEDTSIRISSLSTKTKGEDSTWNSVQCLRTMSNHVTGLQQIKWSDDGRFLFSSAGREEFFVWRIRSIPQFGITALMEAACPREDSETEHRITDFDVLHVQSSADEDRFLLALVYSNSTIKVFLYKTSADATQTYSLLGRGTYSTNCLTGVHFLVGESKIFLVTGATDGCLAFWPVEWITHNGINDYIINVILVPRPDSLSAVRSIKWERHHAVHASGIKTLEQAKILPDLKVLISGGDDNSLSITLVKLNSDVYVVSSVSIRTAHASTITVIKVLNIRYESSGRNNTAALEVVSSGNDQRIKVWSVLINFQNERTSLEQAISVALKSNQFCPIADIAAMDVIDLGESTASYAGRDSADGEILVIGGVGVEVVRLENFQ